jgi:hypothetical protein
MLDQLAPIAEAPQHTDRPHPGVHGRLHVDRAVADE